MKASCMALDPCQPPLLLGVARHCPSMRCHMILAPALHCVASRGKRPGWAALIPCSMVLRKARP